MSDERGLKADEVVDTTALTTLWDEKWPGCSKVPYELRGMRDRWVRFHTLPASKRYPETESEYEVILRRHNTVLSELADGSKVFVVTAGYSDEMKPQASDRSAETVAVHPDASYWTSVCIDDDPGCESYMHLYVSRMRSSSGCVDPLLRLVADDVIANVLVADVGLRWLYHPYDGGMDVITSSVAEREALKERHRDWLSAHPAGL
jgi:hypothetical protein